MARLLDWQARVAKLTPVSGPASAGSGSNTLANGSEQTFAGFNSAWVFDMAFPPSQGQQARREYGWMIALHNGANAARYQYVDGERMTPVEAGLPASATWDCTWDCTWETGYETVTLSAAVAKDATQVTLADELWGHSLNYGDVIGFGTAYFGAHVVTEVISAGTYRVWPPIRKALTTSEHRANLEPTLALRFKPNSVNYGDFMPAYATGRGGQFIEVFDEYIQTDFVS